MAALEAIVAAHPATTFIGVHAGCCAEDLAWVSQMLEQYPNFNIDIAARIAELGRQPRATRALIMNHPGRVLFGTDEIPPKRSTYEIYFRFLETADECFPYSPDNPPGSGRWPISGLDLPADVLAAGLRRERRAAHPRPGCPVAAARPRSAGPCRPACCSATARRSSTPATCLR